MQSQARGAVPVRGTRSMSPLTSVGEVLYDVPSNVCWRGLYDVPSNVLAKGLHDVPSNVWRRGLHDVPSNVLTKGLRDVPRRNGTPAGYPERPFRPRGAPRTDFYRFWGAPERHQKIMILGHRTKQPKSENQSTRASSGSDFGPIFMDFGSHFGIDFSTFSKNR